MKTPSRDLWNSESKRSIPANESRQCHLPATVTLGFCLYMSFMCGRESVGIFMTAHVVKRVSFLMSSICMLNTNHFSFLVCLKEGRNFKQTKKKSAKLMSSFPSLFFFFLPSFATRLQGGRQAPVGQQTPPTASNLRPPSHPREC